MATSVIPTICSTRGAFFEPLSVRTERMKQERREARAAAIQRENLRKRDARNLDKKQAAQDAAAGRDARGVFHADSDAPAFERLKGKKYNW